MKNTATFLFFITISSFGASKCFAEVPSFLEIQIGGEYPFAIDWSRVGSNSPRPTEQFRAPNRGKYSSLFPEYEVAILRENNQIAIITAERSVENIRICTESASKFRNQLSEGLPSLQWDSERRIFESESSDVFYQVTCIQSGGSPFWKLRYQARGKQQDERLKAAWEKFLGGSH